MHPRLGDTNDSTVGEESKPASRTLPRGSAVGRYLVLDLLGEGGMGVVYKAYDPELDRAVALKLVRTADDASNAQRDRLLREAQALARLSHPNVIAVHDVGTFHRDVFIAMEFVEGQTLRAWLQESPRSQRDIVDAFLAAGEGLEAAHRAGLVHRDFKPDNVMVGKDARVRVLDFGVARAAHTDGEAGPTLRTEGQATPTPTPPADGDLQTVTARARSDRPAVAPPASDSSAPLPSDSSAPPSGVSTAPRLLATPLTHAGATVGTPRFMAPEQYLGQPIDEKVDQFSFCISLHWALYGTYPFDGVTLDHAMKNMLAGKIADPPPESRVPRWLRQVLARGLRVEPGQRFASMAALLAALRADPRAARRRFARAVLAALAVAAVASALVAGVLVLQVRRTATEQARLGQQFGQEVERIAAISRYAASLPLHDTKREMDLVRERLAKLEQRTAALGSVAAGPGHEALGRGYLALERYDDALAELQTAWSSGYRSPELAQALGLVHGKLYQRALADLPKTSDEKLDAARRAELARKYRDPALRYLREPGTRENTDAPEYVEGLIALYEQRFDEALALAQKAAQHPLWLYEGRTLEGDIHLMAGRERYWKGDVDAALDQYRRAGAAYRAAAEVARSGAAAYAGDCLRLVETSVIEVDRDRSPEATVKEALSACGAAAAARSDDPTPLSAQARAWQHLGNYQTRHGVDPTPANLEAIRLGEKALAASPREVRAHYVIGWAFLTIGEYATAHNKDPRTWLEQGIAHAQKAGEIDPGFSQSYSLLCHLYNARGDFEQSSGEDPRPSFQSAAKWARKAVEVSPDSFHAYNALGIALTSAASWELRHGSDPTESLTRAAEAYGQVKKLGPTLDYGFINGCQVYLDWGAFQSARGIDPQPQLEQAIADCQRALQIDDNYAGTYLFLGTAYHELAAWQLLHSIDPHPAIAQSRAVLERSLKVNPAYDEGLQALADSQLLEARWNLQHKRDPEASIAAGQAFARRALAIADGKSPESLTLLAELSRRRAEWRLAQGLASAGEVREGLSLATRAFAQNARYAPASLAEGALHLVSARAARSPGDRRAAASRARSALDRALTVDGNLDREVRPLLTEADELAR
jgi:serine/threonine-protein kinase